MRLLHELISDYAAAFPDKTAVKDEHSRVCYGELEAVTAAFSCRLRSLGLMPGDTAAVYVPYTKEIITGAVSVLRSGGIFIPFDDGYPVKRLEYMLEDSGAKAILTTRALRMAVPRFTFIRRIKAPKWFLSIQLTQEARHIIDWRTGSVMRFPLQ